MISQKQLTANIENAKLSTGPQSEAGKKIVRANGATHGVFTRPEILLIHLSEQQRFDELVNTLKRDFGPATPTMLTFIRLLALDLIRLDRLIDFDTCWLRNAWAGKVTENEEVFWDRYWRGERADLEDYPVPVLRKLPEELTRSFQVQAVMGKFDVNEALMDFLFRRACEVDVNVSSLLGADIQDVPVNMENAMKLLSAINVNPQRSWDELMQWLRTKMEADIEEAEQRREGRKHLYDKEMLAGVFFKDHSETTEKVGKYEARLRKQIAQGIRQLRELREMADAMADIPPSDEPVSDSHPDVEA